MGCEKIKNNAPPGFNGCPISRTSPMEIRITAPPSIDGDRTDTFYHILYCNVRLIIRCGLYVDKRTKSCQHLGVPLILGAAYNREITVFLFLPAVQLKKLNKTVQLLGGNAAKMAFSMVKNDPDASAALSKI